MDTLSAPTPLVDPTARAWGDEVRYRRTEVRKLTQAQLADELGVHQTVVSKIEKGRIVPSARLQRRLIEVCRIDNRTLVRLVKGQS